MPNNEIIHQGKTIGFINNDTEWQMQKILKLNPENEIVMIEKSLIKNINECR